MFESRVGRKFISSMGGKYENILDQVWDGTKFYRSKFNIAKHHDWEIKKIK